MITVVPTSPQNNGIQSGILRNCGFAYLHPPPILTITTSTIAPPRVSPIYQRNSRLMGNSRRLRSVNAIRSNDSMNGCLQSVTMPDEAHKRIPTAIKKREDINLVYAQQESNLYQKLRKLLFYPLNYGREYLPYCTTNVPDPAMFAAFPEESSHLSSGPRYQPRCDRVVHGMEYILPRIPAVYPSADHPEE
jgi:hypothetical protein